MISQGARGHQGLVKVSPQREQPCPIVNEIVPQLRSKPELAQHRMHEEIDRMVITVAIPRMGKIDELRTFVSEDLRKICQQGFASVGGSGPIGPLIGDSANFRVA
jgi:hypothetical protein